MAVMFIHSASNSNHLITTDFWNPAIVDLLQSQIKIELENKHMRKSSLVLLGTLIFSILLIPLVANLPIAMALIHTGPVPFPAYLIPHPSTPNHHIPKNHTGPVPFPAYLIPHPSTPNHNHIAKPH
jgi:hypothetical protein